MPFVATDEVSYDPVIAWVFVHYPLSLGVNALLACALSEGIIKRRTQLLSPPDSEFLNSLIVLLLVLFNLYLYHRLGTFAAHQITSGSLDKILSLWVILLGCLLLLASLRSIENLVATFEAFPSTKKETAQEATVVPGGCNKSESITVHHLDSKLHSR